MSHGARRSDTPYLFGNLKMRIAAPADAKQSLNAHVASKGDEIRDRYGPVLTVFCPTPDQLRPTYWSEESGGELEEPEGGEHFGLEILVVKIEWVNGFGRVRCFARAEVGQHGLYVGPYPARAALQSQRRSASSRGPALQRHPLAKLVPAANFSAIFSANSYRNAEFSPKSSRQS